MEALLAPSLMAARAGVPEKEKVFHIVDHVFLGTKFGAGDRQLLDGCGIGAVVNLTAADSRVPNHFEGSGIEYLHVELMDELLTDPLPAVPRGCAAITWWGSQGTRVLVHCHAGLSRSATVVIAWLMRERGFSLEAAASLMMQRRGRRPRCNPAFWCFLAGLERELRGWKPTTPPSFDFTQWLVEDLADLGLKFSEQQITEALQVDGDWVHFELFYFALCGHGIQRLVRYRRLAQRRDMAFAEAKKAAEGALEIMQVYKALPALQVSCLQILQQLVLHGQDGQLGSAIASAGGISKTLHTMISHMDVADVVSSSFAALAYLGACSSHIVGEIVLLGGIPAVLQAMTEHGSSAEVQANGCAVLVVLASRGGCEVELVNAGAVQAALRAMWGHSKAVSVQDFGCAIIASLAQDPGGWASAVGLGAEQAVTRAMLMHSRSAAVQEKGNKALAALSAPKGGQQQYHEFYAPYKPPVSPAGAWALPQALPQQSAGPSRLLGA